jgi:hypothetical protein
LPAAPRGQSVYQNMLPVAEPDVEIAIGGDHIKFTVDDGNVYRNLHKLFPADQFDEFLICGVHLKLR